MTHLAPYEIVLQTTQIVFPHHPLLLLLVVCMEISMHFHGLETII